MPIGLTASLTRGQVDYNLGALSQKLNTLMEDVDDFQFFVVGAQDTDFATLGYTADEITLLRTCSAEMDQLRRIYQGLEALADAKDFRTFLRRVWGTGFPPPPPGTGL